MSSDQVKMEQKPETNGQMKMDQNQAQQQQSQQNRQNDQHSARRGGFGGRGGKFNGPRKDHQKMETHQHADGDNKPNSGGFTGGRGGHGGRGRRGGGQMRDRDQAPRDSSFVNERLLKQISGPTLDLPPQEFKEKMFNGRCRLYIGNLPPDATEDEFLKLFQPYGLTSELYINKEKNFAFIRLDYRSTAEKAKRELDGHSFKNRNLKVRFAPIGAAVKVKNLTQHVTNELLELAFSVFGEVERAIVFVDERGNSLREGLVEFTRKVGATSALRFCSEGCFFLTSTLRPVILEPYDVVEDTDGYSEKSIVKKGADYFEARESGPRFAKQGSFEFEFGTRWKQIHELYKQKEEALKREMKLEEDKLEAQMQYARYEHETELLREQLRQRELDRERQKREWEMKERQAEEQRIVEEEALRRQQEELSRRMSHQDDELRRRQQENSLFMQGQQLNNLMDQQEASMQRGYNNSAGDNLRDYEGMEGQRQGEANYMDMGYSGRGGNRYDGRTDGMMEDIATRRPQQGGGRWGHQERRSQGDDFPSKRRRY
ncbi:hrp65 protein-like isoform X2 [Cimex lectularius]|uniref:RRM domain-containing protein n=1 Tax=Cimex lectularius TaxID=79782 RepID=A0A8I6TJI8_CIMLE|nr:hrp65 protein-like isoform X2 [Cimex lectularius]